MIKVPEPKLEAEIDRTLKIIGNKVRMHRKSIAKNNLKFSEGNNINKITLCRIENGENYNMRSFIWILRKMNISIEDFFNGIK
jgi:hypothetical protein